MDNKLFYRFMDKEQRNRFLSLIASNVGTSGYGFGLEFRGLENSLKADNARGDLISHVGPMARGEWELRGPAVELDMFFIASAREGFDRLRQRLWEIASQFGAGQY